jgi:hypothetical protein
MSELELDRARLHDRRGNINLDSILCVRKSLIATSVIA